MRAIQLTNVKQFMADMLVKDVFDSFYVSEAVIRMACTYKIDGRINQSFFTSEEREEIGDREYLFWKDVKPFVFSIIKGNKTPDSMKIVLNLPETELEKFGFNEVTGMCINFRFEAGSLTAVTGIVKNTFTTDKTSDNIWDDYVEKLLVDYI